MEMRAIRRIEQRLPVAEIEDWMLTAGLRADGGARARTETSWGAVLGFPGPLFLTSPVNTRVQATPSRLLSFGWAMGAL